MTPAEADVHVERATDDDIRTAVGKLMDDAGFTFEELREQAEAGAFCSEEARTAWFMASSFRDLFEAQDA